jgi:phage protein D
MAASSTPNLPRMAVSINGTIVQDCILSLDVTNNNYFSPDTFRAELALGRLPAQFNAAFWSDTQAQIGLMVGMSPTLTTLIVGNADEIELDLPNGTVSVSGRDLSAYFIDNKSEEKFQNQTSSEIVATLAARAGLTANVTATSAPVGRYYDISEWTLLNYLAQEEGFDIYVTGTTLNFQPSAQGSAPAYTLTYTPPSQGQLQAGNFIDLKCRRSQTLAKGTVVKVISWNAKQQTAFTATAKRVGSGAGSVAAGTAQLYTFKMPGLDQGQAQLIANAKLDEITKHERKIDVTLPGELLLQPRQLVAVTGTGTSFDQSYFIDEINRRVSLEEGFMETIRMKNHSPESTVSA